MILEERFWSKVSMGNPGDCWEWQGAKVRGYGYVRFSGKTMRAHRVSWMIHNQKQVPQHMHVCHSCDNPSCVNPSHLWIGTNSENMRDMYKKGRQNKLTCFTKKTHCKRGHEFTPENTIARSGRKSCRTCVNMLYRKRWAANKQPARKRTPGARSAKEE